MPSQRRRHADARRRRRSPGRALVTRSAVAAGPMSRAVERIEPMAIDDRPTGDRQGQHERQADDPHADAPGRGQLRADRAEQQRAVDARPTTTSGERR